MVFSSNEDSCKHDPRFLRYYTTKQRTKRTFMFIWHMTNAAVLRFFVPEGLKESSAGVFQNPAKCPASLRLIVQRPRGKKYTCWFIILLFPESIHRSKGTNRFPSAVRFFLLFTIYLLMHLSCPLTSARFFIISSQNRQNPAIHSSHFLGIVITVKAKRPITHHFFIHPLLFFKKKELLPSRVPSFFAR